MFKNGFIVISSPYSISYGLYYYLGTTISPSIIPVLNRSENGDIVYRENWRKATAMVRQRRRTAINRSSSVFVANCYRGEHSATTGGCLGRGCATTIGLFGRLAHLFRIRKGFSLSALAATPLASLPTRPAVTHAQPEIIIHLLFLFSVLTLTRARAYTHTQ